MRDMHSCGTLKCSPAAPCVHYSTPGCEFPSAHRAHALQCFYTIHIQDASMAIRQPLPAMPRCPTECDALVNSAPSTAMSLWSSFLPAFPQRRQGSTRRNPDTPLDTTPLRHTTHPPPHHTNHYTSRHTPLHHTNPYTSRRTPLRYTIPRHLTTLSSTTPHTTTPLHHYTTWHT